MTGNIINHLFDGILNGILRMSKTSLNYWGEFAIDIPLGIILIITGLHTHELGFIPVSLTMLLGMFLFSFAEYSVHRWLFHGSVTILAQGHHAHHENPLGYVSIPFFFPAIVLLMLTGVFSFLMQTNYAFVLTGTMALCYVIYGLSHHIIHHHRFHQVMARNWAANHHIHHYHAETNFGVTSPLWDVLLRTRYEYGYKK